MFRTSTSVSTESIPLMILLMRTTVNDIVINKDKDATVRPSDDIKTSIKKHE